MEPVKTSGNVWSGIVNCLVLGFWIAVILTVAGWGCTKWMEFILYGGAHKFIKSIILLFPMISIPLVITYLLDRNRLI